MKSVRFFAAAMLLLCLTACSPIESMDLIRSEAGEIAAFFGDFTPSREPGVHVSAAEPDQPSRPILETRTHTEIIESVYNSHSDPAAVASVGKSGESLASKPVTLTAAEKLRYTGVPRFTDPDVTAVSDSFALLIAGFPMVWALNCICIMIYYRFSHWEEKSLSFLHKK